MRRKVIQIAGSTQLVSLPRAWAKRNNIQKGQEVEVLEEVDRIIITTDKDPTKNIASIDLSGLTPRLADRMLTRAYQLGYDELTIKFDKIEIGIALQNKVRELLGFDIFEQEEGMLVIKSISSKLDIDFDNALRKTFLIANSMAESCLEGFKKNNKNTLESLRYRDLDLNKFCYFCLRAINKGHYREFDRFIMYYLIETLEDVGDAYKELAKELSKLPPKQKIATLIEKINKILRASYSFFYKPEKDFVLDVDDLLKETKKAIINASNNSTVEERHAIRTIDYLSRLLYHFTTMRLDKLRELKITK